MVKNFGKVGACRGLKAITKNQALKESQAPFDILFAS